MEYYKNKKIGLIIAEKQLTLCLEDKILHHRNCHIIDKWGDCCCDCLDTIEVILDNLKILKMKLLNTKNKMYRLKLASCVHNLPSPKSYKFLKPIIEKRNEKYIMCHNLKNTI